MKTKPELHDLIAAAALADEVDMLDDIKTKWSIPVTLPIIVPWGKDDVVWLVGEVTRLRAEVAALREACTLALRIMEQKNKVNVPSYVKTVTVDFAPEDVAVLRAALDPPATPLTPPTATPATPPTPPTTPPTLTPTSPPWSQNENNN